MISHIDALIEKDGTLAKLAGVASGALVSLVAAGLVPPEHVETAVAISVMLASFAPAAMRRDVLAKRKALPDMPESMTETTEAPDESA